MTDTTPTTPARRRSAAVALVDAVLYGGSAAGALWLALTYLAHMFGGPALMLAGLAAAVVAARVWRAGPPVLPVIPGRASRERS
jgi:hypothetical protein